MAASKDQGSSQGSGRGQGTLQGSGQGMRSRTGTGQSMGGARSGKGKGRMGGRALGPDGDCVCTQCGTRAPHQRGVPCYEQMCPKCGIPMVRG